MRSSSTTHDRLADEQDSDQLEILRTIIRIGEHLSSARTLEARMGLLCEETTSLLGCDRTTIFLWCGESYRPIFRRTNLPDMAQPFASVRLPADAPLIVEMEASGGFVAINNTGVDAEVRRLAELARINSMVLAPMVRSDGSRLGFLSAEFSEPMGDFDDHRGEIAVGVARLAQTAVLTDEDLRRRRQADLGQAVILARLVDAEDGERRRLARELHDDPIQRLFALRIRLETAEATQKPIQLQDIKRLIAETLATTDSLRSILTDLHPTAIDGKTLGTALNHALARRAESSGWSVSVVDDNTTQPPAANLTVLFRIALQAIQNAAIHASASTVAIHLRTVDGGSEVRVSDNGCGFDPSGVNNDRFGLTTMSERASSAGGSFRIKSSPGEGTEVTAWLPNSELSTS